ncbi:O-antigen ligase family protein [Curtobacterium sp. RRHDQ10]|uniref:O-antigen ligase family protein n=1 Tax=Curtobacterium phyllosphaerae TaxID=3413379 RepID=UPI003BEFDFBE
MTNTWPLARRRVPEREAFAFAATLLFIVFAGDGVSNLLSYYGWAVVCAAAGAWGVSILVRARPSFRRTPPGLWILLGWCLLSVAWSHWRIATISSLLAQVLCTLVAFVVASTLSWRRIVDALSLALRWVLSLSLVFEFVVAVVVRHPVYPVWTHYGDRKVPDAFAFSRAELFTGGRIQGLPGNANLLAMVALLAAIAVGIQLAEDRMKRVRATGWLVVAAAVFLLTRSSTVIVAAVVVAVVLFAAVAVRRVPTGRRAPWYLGGLTAVLLVGGLVAVASRPITALLGRNATLTGRSDIWSDVWNELVVHHPVLGWGWIGYWWPAISPLNHVHVQNGVTYLQAHNAYLDMWMQIGAIGLVLFLVYVIGAVVRSWWNATAISRGPDLEPKPFDPVSLAALLLVTALLVQSFAESRLLYEGNWILFAILAIKTRSVLVGEEPVSTGDGPRTPVARREFRRGAADGRATRERAPREPARRESSRRL